jgi:hypothetical protein
LWKKLGDKNFLSYKSFYNHIKILEGSNFIKLEKNPRASGQAVTIKYVDNMEKCEHIYRIFKDPNEVMEGTLTFYCQKCLEWHHISYSKKIS